MPKLLRNALGGGPQTKGVAAIAIALHHLIEDLSRGAALVDVRIEVANVRSCRVEDRCRTIIARARTFMAGNNDLRFERRDEVETG